MATYEKGDSNTEEVARFQAPIGVTADGKFGPATVNAVKAWQKANGMKADGMVGPDMLLALGLNDLIILEKWDEGQLVRNVQERVGVKIDGVYGDRTIAAVRAWQKQNGLKANGVADWRTLEQMGVVGHPVAAQPAAPAARAPAPSPPTRAPQPTPAPASAPVPEASSGGGWWPWSRKNTVAPAPAAQPAVRSWRPAPEQLQTWAYQLADVDADTIASLNVDLAVIDYSAHGDEDSRFSPSDVARMKQRTDGGQKLLVSYMSIGEAEDYRFYWNDRWQPGVSPAWLDALNPDWPGNFKVRYWDPEWQRVILGHKDGYLDKILGAGFDGVYLDIIDAFEYWRDTKQERRDAADQMIAFVRRIAEYARARNPNFLVIPQNGEALLEDAGYRSFVSVQAKEDIFYGADGDGKANDRGSVKDCLDYLAYARADGIPIVAIEYLDKDGVIGRVREQLSEAGCVPYFGPRDLASIPTGQFGA